MLRRMVLVALLLCASTAVQAQDLQAWVEAPTQPVQPESASVPLVVHVTVACKAILAEGGAFVRIGFVMPHGIVVTGESTVVIPATDCTSGSLDVTRSQTFQMTVPRTAPGLQSIQGLVRVEIEHRVPVAAAPPAVEVKFAVTIDYSDLSLVKVASKLKACSGPCQLVYEIEVTNFGNARTAYTFEVVDRPGGDGWNELVPEVLLLDSPNVGQGLNVGVATFTVGVPAGGHEGTYSLLVKPAAAENPDKTGEPLRVDVLARDTGIVSKLTPGPGPLLPLALVALASLLSRRRA